MNPDLDDHETKPDPLAGRPYEGDQAPLFLNWNMRRHWQPIAEHFECTETGAAILVSMWSEAQTAGRFISYTRTCKTFHERERISRIHGFRGILSEIDRMTHRGDVDHFRQLPGERGWQSCIRGRPLAMAVVDEIIRGIGLPRPEAPQDTIILRDEKGEPMKLPETERVRRWRNSMEAFNEAIGSADILGGSACMVRIFNEAQDFSRGGRMYSRGGWQLLPEQDRLRLTIGGEGVCELDWKTIHPVFLYNAEGLTPPRDAYDIGGDWPRDLVKVALMVVINAPYYAKALHAIANDDEMVACAPVGSKDAIAMARVLIRQLKTAHKPISRWFYSDAGSRLMLRDSMLAEKVLKRLMRRGIVCLPIHDSFLVQLGWRDVLEEVMNDVAEEEGIVGLRIEENLLKAA